MGTRTKGTTVSMDRKRLKVLDNVCQTLDLNDADWKQCHSRVADLLKELHEARALLLRSRTGLENMVSQEVFVFLSHEEQSKQEIALIDAYLKNTRQ